LIYTLNNIDKSTRKRLIYILKNENKNPASVSFVIEKVMTNGGMEYAESKMIQYKNEALSILHSFPDSPVRKALEELVLFTTDRKY
jgi:octaprenyl-diphosphate synthase